MNDRMKSRREFLTSTLCAGIGIGAVGTLTRERVFAAESAGKMRLGLATYQWGMNWDIPALIANLQKAKVLGVELRTQSQYKHGVELELNLTQRTEVKKRFADSPVRIVAIACSERMDWPEPGSSKPLSRPRRNTSNSPMTWAPARCGCSPTNFTPMFPRKRPLGRSPKP